MKDEDIKKKFEDIKKKLEDIKKIFSKIFSVAWVKERKILVGSVAVVAVIGLIEVTKKIPKKIDITLGTNIIVKLDNPETLRAIISSVFFIFKKNQIPDNKTIKGNIL